MAHYAKGTRSPHKGAPILWTHQISETISSPFRGAFHLSLAVLIHYRSPELFSLGRWSSQIQAGFHVSDPTQDTPTKCSVSATGLSPSMAARSRVVCLQNTYRLRSPTTPVHKINGFGLFPFRSPLLRESLLIYLPLLLRCFSSQSDHNI